MPFFVPSMLTINGTSGVFFGYFVVSTIDHFVLVRYLKLHFIYANLASLCLQVAFFTLG